MIPPTFPGARSAPMTSTAMLCSTRVGRGTTLGLRVFAGTYTLTWAAARDTSDIVILAGFKTIGIPSAMGIFWRPGYSAVDHGNFAWGDAPRWWAKWDNASFGGGIISSDVDAEFRTATNAGWCTNRDDNRFYFRAGIQQDIRYEARDVFTVAACRALPGFLGGGAGCARRYRGLRVYPTLLDTMVGFPVQTYSVIYPPASGNAGYVASVTTEATNQAQALYESWARDRQMVFSTYELELYGYVYPCGGRYCRQLYGEIRRRLYQDQRVGLIDTIGGSEFRMTVMFEGQSLSSGAGASVRALCGGAASCGGPVDTVLADGGLDIRGTDDSLQFTKMCKSYNTNADCVSLANATAPPMGVNPARVDSVVSGPGNTGRPITDAERTTALEGTRGGPTTPKAPHQFSRNCERRAQEDSIARANGPVPEFSPFPLGVTRDTALYSACLSTTGPPLVAAPPPSASTPPPFTPAGCKIVMGQLYCPPTRRSP